MASETLRLSRIRVYPLKGAAGIDLEETRLDEMGIPGDRRWMLVRPDGLFLSQRTYPRLCLIRSEPKDDGPGPSMRFRLTAPGVGTLELEPVERGDSMEVRLHGDRVSALLCRSAADDWFSRFLDTPCRLVFIPDAVHRAVDPAYGPGHRVGFADGYPLHLTTEESLRDLNRRLPGKTSMLRYRPNLVVEGGKAWEEDEWRTLRIGDATVRVVKPCARCVVTSVHPATGIREAEPLRTLKRFRESGGKVYFGQNAVSVGGGRFRVGSDVHIVERGTRRPELPGD